MPDQPDPQAALGAAIKRLRGSMTQEELGLRTGNPQSWISEIEAGKVNVTWGNFWRIADGLEVSVAELAAAALEVANEESRPA